MGPQAGHGRRAGGPLRPAARGHEGSARGYCIIILYML